MTSFNLFKMTLVRKQKNKIEQQKKKTELPHKKKCYKNTAKLFKLK